MIRNLITALALALVWAGCSTPPSDNNGDGTLKIDTGRDTGGEDTGRDAGGSGDDMSDPDDMSNPDDTGDPDDCRTAGCSDTQVCDRTSGECVDCLTDNECGLNGSCDPQDNTCSCDDGYHNCQGECVDDTSVESCGDSCDPCPDDPNGTRACVNGSCTLACDGDFVLDDATMACVECRSNDDCTDPAASTCDGGTCVACSGAADCSHIPDTGLCSDDGVCVECSLDDDSACGNNSCDVANGACTQTPRDSVETCEPCVATSECMGIDVCVPMQFDGNDRASAYCLTLDTGTCEAPYPIARSVTTVGGAMADICTLNEDFTTCEGLLDYMSSCSDDSDCGADGLDDGVCEVVEFEFSRCSIPCSDIDSGECPNTPGFYCATVDANTGERCCGCL